MAQATSWTTKCYKLKSIYTIFCINVIEFPNYYEKLEDASARKVSREENFYLRVKKENSPF